jgi:hypothetical protein
MITCIVYLNSQYFNLGKAGTQSEPSTDITGCVELDPSYRQPGDKSGEGQCSCSKCTPFMDMSGFIFVAEKLHPSGER